MEIHIVGPCYPCYLLDEEVQSPELLGMRKQLSDSKSEIPDASPGSASKML